MRIDGTFGSWGRVVVGTAMLGAVWIGPASAHEREHDEPRCPRGATLVRLETKTCAPRRNQPPLTVKRACCQSKNEKTHCDHMPHCPSNSPS